LFLQRSSLFFLSEASKKKRNVKDESEKCGWIWSWSNLPQQSRDLSAVTDGSIRNHNYNKESPAEIRTTQQYNTKGRFNQSPEKFGVKNKKKLSISRLCHHFIFIETMNENKNSSKNHRRK
jgi:hypothetical protein